MNIFKTELNGVKLHKTAKKVSYPYRLLFDEMKSPVIKRKSRIVTGFFAVLSVDNCGQKWTTKCYFLLRKCYVSQDFNCFYLIRVSLLQFFRYVHVNVARDVAVSVTASA